MDDTAINALEKWCQKHRRFQIVGGPFCQPGDGISVVLTGKGRRVEVNGDELIDHAKDYFPTISELILLAIEKWEHLND